MSIPSLRKDQQTFFETGRTRELAFRLDAVDRLDKAVRRFEPRILEALDEDLGKPGFEAFISEIHFLLSELRLYRKKLKSWSKPERASNPLYFFPSRSVIRREPFGCALLISPWNYPVQISLASLLSAVAAGNCVILKPSELAPASSALLAELIAETFEPAHVAVAEGGATVSQELLAEPFDIIFYTGSGRIGKIVARAAAEHLTPTVLELGGKCPVVVDEDVDLDLAANRIAAAKFFNAGQTCLAPDYVLAHPKIREPLTGKLRENITRFFRNGFEGDFSRIINERHYRRLRELLEGQENAAPVIGEDHPDKLVLAPRVLSSAGWDSPVMQDEIFGPILPVLEFADEGELISRLRQRGDPLALYVFSRKLEFARRISSAVPSGSVCINDLIKQSANLDLPFGGVGESGMGRYRGKYGFDTFTYQRPEMRRWFCRDLLAVHPPYAGKLERFRKFLG